MHFSLFIGKTTLPFVNKKPLAGKSSMREKLDMPQLRCSPIKIENFHFYPLSAEDVPS